MIYSSEKHPPEISDTPNEFLLPCVRWRLHVYMCVCMHAYACVEINGLKKKERQKENVHCFAKMVLLIVMFRRVLYLEKCSVNPVKILNVIARAYRYFLYLLENCLYGTWKLAATFYNVNKKM